MQLKVVDTFGTIDARSGRARAAGTHIYWTFLHIVPLEEDRNNNMKNPIIFYAVIAIGIIGLAAGVYYEFLDHIHHALRGPVGLGGGVVLLIIGIVGLFMARSRAAISK